MSVAPVEAASDAARTEYEAKRAAVLAALKGRIEPVRTSPGYAAAALLVCIVMLLLPLLYVVLVAAVGYATYLHAVYDTGILATKVRGKGYLFVLLLYLAPIFIGAIVCLFLIKPLFARPAKVDRRRSLTRAGEPLLFEFVDRLCAAVGAPAPRRIDVDLQVNASASFRRGLLSMLGNDLVLTLGLPLAAGLTCRQFAGVLAHEFGHFTQGAGMRLSYVIRAVSMWFARVVYERDVWDERLDAWSRDGGHWSVMLTAALAKLGVRLGRWVLKGLMYVGHAVSGVMLRQMEYDADLHEIRLAGSRTFAETSRRLNPLGVALNVSFDDLNEFYRDGRLGDNLPALVVSNDAAMPDEVRRKIADGAAAAKTGFFDTHPCDHDRIAAAERVGAPGIFTYDGPASDLFVDFAALARNTTLDLYRGIFGPQVKAEDLQSVERLLIGQKTEQAFRESLARFFLDGYRVRNPLTLPWDAPQAPADPKATAHLLRERRKQLLERRGAKKAEEFEPNDEFRTLAVERLTAALQLLNLPAVQARVEDGAALCGEVGKIYSAARLVQRQVPQVVELSDTHDRLGAAVEAFSRSQNEDHRREALQWMGDLFSQLKGVHKSLADEPYPLDHAEANLTVARFLLKDLPPSDDLGALHEAVSRLLDNYAFLNLRLTGRLTTAAEKVETALKLPPLTLTPPGETAAPQLTTAGGPETGVVNGDAIA